MVREKWRRWHETWLCVTFRLRLTTSLPKQKSPTNLSLLYAMSNDWKSTKANITKFLASNFGKLVSNIIIHITNIIADTRKVTKNDATGAIIFNPADYCPYSDVCMSFQKHARGVTGFKGILSHLTKVHSNEIYFIIPCKCFKSQILYHYWRKSIGTLKDLVKYEAECPGTAKNIIRGIKKGHLKFSPAASSPAEELAIEKKLQTLFAEKRHSDHCEIFLDKAVPQTSRNINRDDIQNLLVGLGGVWSRSAPSTIGASGKADATRVCIFVRIEKSIPFTQLTLVPDACNSDAC